MGFHEAVALSDGDQSDTTSSYASAITATRLVLMRNLRSIEERDATGATPIIRACQLGRTAIVKLLVEAGAMLHAAATDTGMLPWHFAAAAGHIEVLEMLAPLMSPALRRAASTEGKSALIYAVENGHFSAAHWILAATESESESSVVQLEATSTEAPSAVAAVARAEDRKTALHLVVETTAAAAQDAAVRGALCEALISRVEASSGVDAMLRFVSHRESRNATAAMTSASDEVTARIVAEALQRARRAILRRRAEKGPHVQEGGRQRRQQQDEEQQREAESLHATRIALVGIASERLATEATAPQARVLTPLMRVLQRMKSVPNPSLLKWWLQQLHHEAREEAQSSSNPALAAAEIIEGHLFDVEPAHGFTAFHFAALASPTVSDEELGGAHAGDAAASASSEAALDTLLTFRLHHVVSVLRPPEPQHASAASSATDILNSGGHSPAASTILSMSSGGATALPSSGHEDAIAALIPASLHLDDLEERVQFIIKPFTIGDAQGNTPVHIAASRRCAPALTALFNLLLACIPRPPPRAERSATAVQSFGIRAVAILEQLHAASQQRNREDMWPLALAACSNDALCVMECANAVLRLDASYREVLYFAKCAIEEELSMLAAEAVAEQLERSSLAAAAASANHPSGAPPAFLLGASTTLPDTAISTSTVNAGGAGLEEPAYPRSSTARTAVGGTADSAHGSFANSSHPSSELLSGHWSGSRRRLRRHETGQSSNLSLQTTARQQMLAGFEDVLADTARLFSTSVKCAAVMSSWAPLSSTGLSGSHQPADAATSAAGVDLSFGESRVFGVSPRLFFENELRRVHSALHQTTVFHFACANEAAESLEALLALWGMGQNLAADDLASTVPTSIAAQTTQQSMAASASLDLARPSPRRPVSAAATPNAMGAQDAEPAVRAVAPLHPLLMPDFSGNTPLMTAASSLNIKVAKLLLTSCGDDALAVQQCLSSTRNRVGLSLMDLIDGVPPRLAQPIGAAECLASPLIDFESMADAIENPFEKFDVAIPLIDPTTEAVGSPFGSPTKGRWVSMTQEGRAESFGRFLFDVVDVRLQRVRDALEHSKAVRAQQAAAQQAAEAKAVAEAVAFESVASNPITRVFPYAQLRVPGGTLDHTMINPRRREEYLSDAEFQEVFGTTREIFSNWSEHKREQRKQQAHLI